MDHLFSFEAGLDELEYSVFLHHDCTLKVDIGEYKAGEKFMQIVMDYDDMIISLYRTAEATIPDARFKLSLTVGEKIND